MGEKPKLNSGLKKTSLLDGLGKKIKEESFSDWGCFQNNLKKKSSVFFTKKGVLRSFYTDQSKLYYTPEEYKIIKKGGQISHVSQRMDSLCYSKKSNFIRLVKREDLIFLAIRHRYSNLKTYVQDLFYGATQGVSMTKMWNLSIVGAVIFGMFSMTMIYRYLGQNVSAKIQEKSATNLEETDSRVLGARDYDVNEEIDIEYITRILEDAESGEIIKQKDFEKEILAMVKNYPIENMVSEIVKQDRIVAAFMIAIAKKESNWGKRVPVLNGEDCFNYWGYRGIRDRMGTGGHTCFDSPRDAVETVGKRIAYLVSETKRNTPSKMVVWKCGYDCSWDSKLAVKKWISDVDLYFRQLNRE